VPLSSRSSSKKEASKQCRTQWPLACRHWCASPSAPASSAALHLSSGRMYSSWLCAWIMVGATWAC